MRRLPQRIAWLADRLDRSFSITGIVVATAFFAASLTPSLLPRSFVQQGLLSGCSFAAGYGVGVFLRWLWLYLEIPPVPAGAQPAFKRTALALSAVAAAGFLWAASDWQDSIHALMGLPPVESARPIEVGGIAAMVFGVLLLIARLFGLILEMVAARLRRRVPPRVAYVIGTAIAVSVFWAAIDGLMFRVALRMADASFQSFDALMEVDVEQPGESLRTGGPDSLVDWRELGRAGRQFASGARPADAIAALGDGTAIEPIRVYVGLNSGETVEERARLALEELRRVGGFERSVLVLITPTGTGWIDPAAMDTLEILHRGDVASVALQYSYLTSWLSLLFEPGYGAEAARALFSAVYGYWTTLPHDTRPRLYLYGISLGALNSDLSVDIFDIVGDPFHGALWVGPPFSSVTWQAATTGRQPESPAWLPRFRDGSVIRFANQHGVTARSRPWGPIRIVFLQYASDPVTFFRSDAAYRAPPWMDAPRGPDVSSSFRWFPIVTQLQLALDMALATTTPRGYGHVYAPEHHIEPWVEVTRPPGWSEDDLAVLRSRLALERDPPAIAGPARGG